MYSIYVYFYVQVNEMCQATQPHCNKITRSQIFSFVKINNVPDYIYPVTKYPGVSYLVFVFKSKRIFPITTDNISPIIVAI